MSKAKKLLLKRLKLMHGQKSKPSEKAILSLLVVGVILVVTSSMALVWDTARQRVEDILPGDKTIAYLEFEDFMLTSKLREFPVNKDMIESSLSQVLNVNFQDAIPNWFKHPFGMVQVSVEGSPANMLFFRSPGRNQVIDFFESLTLDGETIVYSRYEHGPVYHFSQGQNLAFGFAGSYVFISSNKNAIGMLLEPNETPLKVEAEYHKAMVNLPRNAWVRGFVRASDVELKDGSMLAGFVGPYKDLVTNVAGTIQRQTSGLKFNTYSSTNKEIAEKVFDATPFAYELANSIDTRGLAAYMGGSNLALEWEGVLDALEKVNPAYGLILEGLLQAQVNRFFTADVDFRKDIYPLFEDEYAFTAGEGENGPEFQLILSHDDYEGRQASLEKLLSGFRFTATMFTPRIHRVELPNGHISEEVMAAKDGIKEGESDYEGYVISCVEIPESAFGFCYTLTDELLIMANDEAVIKSTIDQSFRPRHSLANAPEFRRSLSNLSKISDEITFVNTEGLSEFVSNTSVGPLALSFLSPFETITWVKHAFSDGSALEGYLLFK